MTVSEKTKTIDNKIEKNKVQYDLDRQTSKISALSSGNVSKHEFLISKDVLPGKYLIEKATTLTRFEYSPLSKWIKSTDWNCKEIISRIRQSFYF